MEKDTVYCRLLGKDIDKAQYKACSKENITCDTCTSPKVKRKDVREPTLPAGFVWKMSTRDRFMALSRCQAYVKDYSDVDMGNMPIRALYEKWGLKIRIRPCLPVDEDLEWLFEKAETLPLTEDDGSHAPSERYHHLRIDLSRNNEELEEAFSKEIQNVKSKPKNSRARRARKVEYDIWEIWDLHHLREISLNEIALKFHEESSLSGRKIPRGKRRPADNKKLWPPYKQVERACKKAEEMIRAVENPSRRPTETDLSLFDTTPRTAANRPADYEERLARGAIIDSSPRSAK